jgi:hypothetical protein
VEKPVEPTQPMTWPAETVSPGLTSIPSWWEYSVVTPPPWSMTVVLP